LFSTTQGASGSTKGVRCIQHRSLSLYRGSICRTGVSEIQQSSTPLGWRPFLSVHKIHWHTEFNTLRLAGGLRIFGIQQILSNLKHSIADGALEFNKILDIGGTDIALVSIGSTGVQLPRASNNKPPFSSNYLLP